MAHIVLINPKTGISFWGYNYALPFFDKDAVVPVAAYALLAALTANKHTIRVFDEALEAIDYEEVAKADIVGLTGMVVQQQRMREIAEKVKQLGKFLIVGGPWITVQEDYLDNLADVIFIGEAEQTWPLFLEQWEAGSHQPRYEQRERTVMSSLPPPRYDLFKMDRYLMGTLQISRGCPFMCEFCDVPGTFGRRPRFKTIPQVIDELDLLYRSGIEESFIIDDNIIGNRKEIIPILHEVIKWQRAHHFPLRLHAEASLNVADDDELMDLFVEANIQTVFVGIETPNTASLIQTKKMQNVERQHRKTPVIDDTPPAPDLFLLKQLHKIHDKGLEVTCGLIVGFDADELSIFEDQRNFLAHSGIMTAMIGLLSAIPKTPLYTRLAAIQRIDDQHIDSFGTNVIPLNMSREQLRDGFVDLVRDVYEPDVYFARLHDLYIQRRFYQRGETIRSQQMSLRTKIEHALLSISWTLRVFPRFLLAVDNRKLRNQYIRSFMTFLLSRPALSRIAAYSSEIVFHYHCYRYTQDMAYGRSGIVSTL